jgi:hypothetical protein
MVFEDWNEKKFWFRYFSKAFQMFMVQLPMKKVFSIKSLIISHAIRHQPQLKKNSFKIKNHSSLKKK